MDPLIEAKYYTHEAFYTCAVIPPFGLNLDRPLFSTKTSLVCTRGFDLGLG